MVDQQRPAIAHSAVVYNASNNELVRTKTLVKNAIVQIDATPFRQWFDAMSFIPAHA